MNETIGRLILHGLRTTMQNYADWVLEVQEYLETHPDGQLAKDIRLLGVYASQHYKDGFRDMHHAVMNRLYAIANLTPAGAVELRRQIIEDDPVLSYLADKAMFHQPMLVQVEPWSPAECPRCGHQLSTHHGDGYYTHPDWMDHCPECHQAIRWHADETDE